MPELSTIIDTTLQISANKLGKAPLTADVTTPTDSNTATLAATAVTPGSYGNATNVAQVTIDAKGRVTGATNVAISAGVADPYAMIFKPGVYASSPTSQAGDFTLGSRFIPTVNANVTGADFYVTGTTVGKNIKITLWSDAGASLATVTVNSVVSGTNRGTFGAPVAVLAGTAYRISMWTTDGTNHTRNNDIINVVATNGALYTNMNKFIAGDAFPTSDAATNRYPINPVFA